MPSWPIHIALANKLNKKLKLNDEFILGNILPDVLDGYIFTPSNITDKNLSHYRTNQKIDLSLFLNEHKDNFNNPIVLGFFTHLLVDKFYNSHIAARHFVEKNDGQYVLLNDGSLIKKSSTTFFMKQNEYTKYGKKIAAKKLLGSPINLDRLSLDYLNDLSMFNYDFSDIKKTTEIMNEWINNKTIVPEIQYKLHTESELDKLYNECYSFVLEYLGKLKRD